MDKLNTALVMDSYYPHIDGVVSVVDTYARIMAQMGDNVQVFVPRALKGYKDELPYPVNRCASFYMFADLAYPMPDLTPKLRTAYKSLAPDIVHVHSPFTMGHYTMKLAHKRGTPVISTFHSKYYDDFMSYTHNKAFADYGLRYIVDFYNSCQEVWTVSNGAAETLHSYGFKGKIEVVYNPLDIDMVYPQNPQINISAADAAFGSAGDGLRLLFVGQMIWHKNHKYILDTCALLAKRGLPFTLTVAGSGEHAGAIKAYAAKLGLEKQVFYVGRVNDKQLLSGLYLRSDLLFFPSVYDTAGMVIREAAVNRVPSLLMRGSNAAEDITEGYNGYLCNQSPQDCADIIMALAADRIGLKAAGVAAAKTLANSGHDVVAGVRERYKRIIAEKSIK